PEEAAAGALAVLDTSLAGRPLPATVGAPLGWDAVEQEAPVPAPRRNLFCVGRNYHAHARELSGTVFQANDGAAEAWPIVFTKVPQTVVGPRADVRLPVGISEQIDYEAELAIVIGKGGANISRADAMNHV